MRGGPGGLSTFAALAVFAVGALVSTVPFNLYLMRRPLSGGPVSLSDYGKGGARWHLLGWLGGAVWTVGTTANLVVGHATGYAVSYAIGQSAPLVASLWGIFVWYEFSPMTRGGRASAGGHVCGRRGGDPRAVVRAVGVSHDLQTSRCHWQLRRHQLPREGGSGGGQDRLRYRRGPVCGWERRESGGGLWCPDPFHRARGRRRQWRNDPLPAQPARCADRHQGVRFRDGQRRGPHWCGAGRPEPHCGDFRRERSSDTGGSGPPDCPAGQHLSLVVLRCETPLPTVERAIEFAASRNTTAILDIAPYRPVNLYRLGRQIHYLVVNETEASQLTGMTVETVQQATQCAGAIRAKGSPCVTITLGAMGCIVADKLGTQHLTAHKVATIDTTGAGDAFVGCLAASLSAGHERLEAVKLANLYAALSTTRPEAQVSLPTKAELEAAWAALRAQ